MCGIAGIVSLGSRPLDRAQRSNLAAMTAAISYRGPDDDQQHIESQIALGFRRLSIVDLAAGRQPLYNEDRSIVVVANGEIFNHADLRRRLAGRHQLRSASDCEVLPHLYEDRGLSMVEDLVGMYAIAIWDRRRRRVVLIRDRFGIKPLFYSVIGDRVLFASEIKALLTHPDCPRDFDWGNALSDPWLAGDAATDLTPPTSFFRDIHPVPAAHMVEIDVASKRVRTQRYWDLPETNERRRPRRAASRRERNKYVEQYRELLDTSVGQCLMSDVEVGLFLSGGIDSVAVAALTSQRQRLHCFTVLSASTVSNEDAQYAHLAAKRLGLPNHQVLFPWDDHRLTPEDWKRLLWLCETPYCGPEQVYKYELHRFARAERPGLKVMLSGQGSDEFNGGYGSVLSPDNPTWSGVLGTIERLDRQRLLRGRIGLRPWEEQLEHPILARGFLDAAPEPGSERLDVWRHYLRTKARDLEMFNLWHEDRTASGNSIENRVPFLDHRLVELTCTIPQEQRASLLTDKRILREAVAPWLPRAFRFRPKVPFFHGKDLRYTNRMMLKLLQAQRGRLVEEALEPAASHDGVLNAEGVRAALRDLERDPEALHVTLLVRLVNMGLLAKMARALPTTGTDAKPLRRAIEINNWDDHAAGMWQRVTSEPGVSDGDIPVLSPGVAVVRRIDQGGAGSVELAVDDAIEFVLDTDPEGLKWVKFLCEIDGARTIDQIAKHLRIGTDSVRKPLEEAIDFGIVTLVSAKRRSRSRSVRQ